MINFTEKQIDDYKVKEEFSDYIITFEFLRKKKFHLTDISFISIQKLAKLYKSNSIDENYEENFLDYQKFILTFLKTSENSKIEREEIKKTLKNEDIKKIEDYFDNPKIEKLDSISKFFNTQIISNKDDITNYLINEKKKIKLAKFYDDLLSYIKYILKNKENDLEKTQYQKVNKSYDEFKESIYLNNFPCFNFINSKLIDISNFKIGYAETEGENLKKFFLDMIFDQLMKLFYNVEYFKFLGDKKNTTSEFKPDYLAKINEYQLMEREDKILEIDSFKDIVKEIKSEHSEIREYMHKFSNIEDLKNMISKFYIPFFITSLNEQKIKHFRFGFCDILFDENIDVITPKKYSISYEEYDFKNEENIPNYLSKIITDLFIVCENIYYLENLKKRYQNITSFSSISNTPLKKKVIKEFNEDDLEKYLLENNYETTKKKNNKIYFLKRKRTEETEIFEEKEEKKKKKDSFSKEDIDINIFQKKEIKNEEKIIIKNENDKEENLKKKTKGEIEKSEKKDDNKEKNEIEIENNEIENELQINENFKINLEGEFVLKKCNENEYKNEIVILSNEIHIRKPISMMEDYKCIIFQKYEDFKCDNTKDFIRLAANIVSALQYIHSLGYLHLDIKPSNILKNGNNYILNDFGLSNNKKLIKKMKGYVGGSHGYSSPEQENEINDKIDEKTDYYSFGLVLLHQIFEIGDYGEFQKNKFKKIIDENDIPNMKDFLESIFNLISYEKEKRDIKLFLKELLNVIIKFNMKEEFRNDFFFKKL
jgi:hypothetical protein